VIPLTITLSNTEEADVYMVQFSSPLTVDIQVSVVSKVTLVGVDPSVYSITMTKQSDVVYKITIQHSQTILATTLKMVYTLDGSPATTNVLRGHWTAEIQSKYLAYMSESTKAAVEAVNKVAGGSMQGAATGAGSMAILGGNPALLWPLLSLFQAFYYLIFIDVNYPANVQMFLKIFSMGSLTFLPNPLNWFVGDIDAYNLPVPPRYNDYNFSGLFLDNAGNELLLVALTFGLYFISKACRKWIRRLPTLLRLSTNKTVEWFEWSGILRSLITSYTDMTQAVFLQMKVLAFYSTVFTLSSILAFLALGFVIIFPIFIFLIIRRFNDHPELLYVKFETLAKEYNVKKKSSRNFVVIWLLRRLIMCLSLVFLQGYPYVQINVLCILMLASIFYSWYFAPFTTKKENICNTLIEVLFGCIHAVVYVLIYDDHNPYFSDNQRLQMGWVIIFACGTILIISMTLSLIEQARVIIRGIRLLKQLLSKKDKPKKKVVSLQKSRLSEDSYLENNDQSVLDISLNASSLPLRSRNKKKIPLKIFNVRNERRTRIAHKIRGLRQVNAK